MPIGILGSHCVRPRRRRRPFQDRSYGELAYTHDNPIFAWFFGFNGFYRKFIRDYAAFAALLTSLLQKDNFHWGEDSQLAFDSLKRAMTQAPVLALPDFSRPFTLETDASGTAMGIVLMQGGHP